MLMNFMAFIPCAIDLQINIQGLYHIISVKSTLKDDVSTQISAF